MKKLIMTIPDLPYAVREAMNRLRVNVKFSGKNTKKIAVVSSVANEGKSSVSVNLWKMLAEAGFKTVLVDADLRKTVLSSRHTYSYEGELQGIDNYLSGLAEYEDIVYETNIQNAYIVPCCNILENPAVLLEDPSFNKLLDTLAEEYRYVIIDTPPMDLVADGSLIASYCDGAIMIIRSGEASKRIIRNSIRQLELVRCQLIGAVINRVPMNMRAYKKYYGKYKNYGKED